MAVASTSNARVLVVEDETVIVKTLSIIFSKEGYEARSVDSAEAALALMETEGWVPSLAILDVHLPGMNGIELAIELKRQHPEVQLTLLSGQAGTADLLEIAREQGQSFAVFAKPVHPTILLKMASELLGNAGQGTDLSPYRMH